MSETRQSDVATNVWTQLNSPAGPSANTKIAGVVALMMYNKPEVQAWRDQVAMGPTA